VYYTAASITTQKACRLSIATAGQASCRRSQRMCTTELFTAEKSIGVYETQKGIFWTESGILPLAD